MALHLLTGEPLWERELGGPLAEILPLEDRLFVGSGDRFFYCLDTRNGRPRWRWRAGADTVGVAVIDEAHVYFASRDNVLRALDNSNGVQRWRRPLPLRPAYSPLLVGGIVIVSGRSPELRGYRAADGEPAGIFTAPAELAAGPGLVEVASGTSMVVILTGEGRLHGLGPQQPASTATPPDVIPASEPAPRNAPSAPEVSR